MVLQSRDIQWTIELDGVPIARLVDPVPMAQRWTSWRLEKIGDDECMLTSAFFAENDDALIFVTDFGTRFKPEVIPFFPVSHNGRILVQDIARAPYAPRKRLRIHLNTALVLMLVMGGFVGLNACRRYEEFPHNRPLRRVVLGWPVSLLETLEIQDPATNEWRLDNRQPDYEFDWVALIVNLSCAAFICVIIGIVCECYLFRQPSNK